MRKKGREYKERWDRGVRKRKERKMWKDRTGDETTGKKESE